ncbi:hypothetical protein [sulfur-oxidizing endosymbiont of Gigantopelta aegis]|uniref:hypothetical protein n=1 Tax=sulfur-oxidizing endosymbiont of Gigantopelta aegis TaxID=2794934 RepID=UPI001BE475DC|nr:hypothetical protein [sulfur-oxidizing endosymbiont of Gigantopelta aegis]
MHVPYGNEVAKDTKALKIQKELSNKELLNVSIKLFEPGKLPEDVDDRKGLSEKIRRSEARFLPIHLKYTMQQTGYWGNVRVVPDESEGSEILVKGKILSSDGESIEVQITVVDAENNQWFQRTYAETVESHHRGKTEVEKLDAFQALYNKISNDIIEYRQKISLAEIEKIKQIAEIRFANYMTPEVYATYLKRNKDNKFELLRLPAISDPMIKRIRNIKSRDEMLVDTINNYYDMYYSNIWDSYDNWRKFRSEELESIREIERKALTQKLIGAAAIVGAIALGASNNSDVVNRTGALRSVMIAAGGYAVYQGFQTSKESAINKEAIEELGESFSNEVEPMIVDVDGKTMKLTGSAEQQYAKWKKLLKEIYHKETGF